MKGKRKREKKIVFHKMKNYSKWIFLPVLCILPLIYYAPLLLGSKMMGGSDWLLGGYSSRNRLADTIMTYRAGHFWNVGSFCGLPFESPNPHTLHTLLYLILPTHVAWTYVFVFSTMLAGIGMYIYIRELLLNNSDENSRLTVKYSALIGALIYMGSGSILSMVAPGHDGKVIACAAFPFILLLLHKGIVQHKLAYFILAGGVGGFFAVNAAHFQLLYYAGIACAFYFLFHIIWQRKELKLSLPLSSYTAVTKIHIIWQRKKLKLKGIIKLLLYAFCGITLFLGFWIGEFLPTLTTLGWGARGVERGYEFATSWSLHPSELIDLITPHFSGILNNYWGGNYFKLDTQYIGILPLILTLFSVIFLIKQSYVKFFVGLAAVSTIFALGGHTPFYHIPYRILPGISKFRGPVMAFYLVAFSFAVLSAYAIQSISLNCFHKKDTKNIKKNVKNTIIFLCSLNGIIFIFAIICSVLEESFLSGLKAHWEPVLMSQYGTQLAQQKMHLLVQNYPNFIGGLWKTLFLIIINSALIILLIQNKIKLFLWTIISGGILIADQWSIEKQFLKIAPHPKEYYKADEIVRFLSGKDDNYSFRVFPLIYGHTTDGYLALHNVHSVGGYVSNPGKRYQKLIGAEQSVMFTPPNLVRYPAILDMLNVKYIISVWLPEDISKYTEETKRGIEELKFSFLSQWGIPFEKFHDRFELIYKSQQGYGIYENKNALPRAWIVHNFEMLAENQTIERLKQIDFNPSTSVVLEKQPSIKDKNSYYEEHKTMKLKAEKMELDEKTYNLEIKEYTPNKIMLEANLEMDGFLVLSENWHPTWKVFVNGKEKEVLRANYTLRAVELEKGKNEIEFIYKCSLTIIGNYLFLFSLLLLIATFIWLKKPASRFFPQLISKS